MIGLLYRDPGLRLSPLWLVIAPLIASATEGVRMNSAVRAMRTGAPLDPDGQLALMALALWLPVALSALFVAGTPRCTRLDLTLPVAGRRLWTAHLIGSIVSSLLVLLACVGVVELRRYGMGFLFEDRPVPTTAVGPLLGPVMATLFLTVVVLQSFHPARRRLPQSWTFRAGTVAVAVLGYVLILLLAKGAPVLLAGPLAAGVAVIVLTRRAVPQVFELMPRNTLGGTTARPRRDTAAKPWTATSPARTLAIVSRILVSGIAPGQLIDVPFSWMGAPFIVVWGGLIAGFPFGVEARLVFGMLAAYLLLAFWPAPLNQLGLLDPLPISRRTLFALLTLPGFALLAVGFVGGRLLLVLRGTTDTLLPPSTPIVLAGVLLLFLLLAMLYMRMFRAHISDGRRKAVYFGILAALVLIQFATIAVLVLGVFNPFEAAVAFEAGVERFVANRFGAAAACWLGSAALLAAGYALAESRFQRIEVPIGRTTRET